MVFYEGHLYSNYLRKSQKNISIINSFMKYVLNLN